ARDRRHPAPRTARGAIRFYRRRAARPGDRGRTMRRARRMTDGLPAFLQVHLPALIDGLRVTLQLWVGGAVLALVLAIAAGLGRGSRRAWLRWPASLYVEIFRGTSALVQLFWFYFALPFFGVSLPALVTGVVVLGLNSGAYGAEVVRSAVANVPRGQREASVALNL